MAVSESQVETDTVPEEEVEAWVVAETETLVEAEAEAGLWQRQRHWWRHRHGGCGRERGIGGGRGEAVYGDTT